MNINSKALLASRQSSIAAKVSRGVYDEPRTANVLSAKQIAVLAHKAKDPQYAGLIRQALLSTPHLSKDLLDILVTTKITLSGMH